MVNLRLMVVDNDIYIYTLADFPIHIWNKNPSMFQSPPTSEIAKRIYNYNFTVICGRQITTLEDGVISTNIHITSMGAHIV